MGKLRRPLPLLRSFGNDEGGSVLPMFALTLIPLIGALGAAVDYARANSVRSSIQSALDSTALMLSKEAKGLTDAQLNAKANAYFKALFTRGDASAINLYIKYENVAANSWSIDMSGASSVATSFMKVMGKDKIDVKATSQVVWGLKRLELALALDNTGSMASSGKMNALKTASKTLIETMKKTSKTPGDIKISIVPFDTTVNIGTGYKNEDWFEYGSLNCGWSGCSSSNWKNYWEGCVRDRTYPYDGQDDAPTSLAATKYPVYDCGSLTTMLPLTSNWTTLNTKIDQMQPNGNTNVTIGLAWAWHSLTTNSPLKEASAPAQDLDKVIILLTDGENTEAWRNSSNSKVTSTNSIDARTALACQNAKAAGIKIYTVRVIEGNADLLRNCASSTTMYYDVKQASELNDVFQSIADSLANLHISK